MHLQPDLAQSLPSLPSPGLRWPFDEAIRAGDKVHPIVSSRCETVRSRRGLGSECLGHGSMSVDDADCRWRAGSRVLSGIRILLCSLAALADDPDP